MTLLFTEINMNFATQKVIDVKEFNLTFKIHFKTSAALS